MNASAPDVLAGRVVVVTGGSAGIGRATVLAFARRGARVAVLALPTDVADPVQVEAAADAIEARWGGIDVWVNNAMATIFAPFDDVAPDDFRRATDVTYLGAVWGTRAALKRMKPRGAGVIVQVGSALAYRSIPLQAPYCAAKAALRGFTDALRSELIHDDSGVRLTMVHLSAFNTPQFEWGRTTMDRQPQPVPPIFQPELAADAIVWAATHDGREWWVGWPATKAILAQRVVPGFADRLLAGQGYTGQQSDAPLPEGRVDNLYAPAPGDHGAHGRFDDEARATSLQWWLVTHHAIVAWGAVVALAAVGTWLAFAG